MKNDAVPSEAARQYAAAHEAHYGAKNLREALGLYQRVMTAHPETQESADSRTQIQNIVKAVVPRQELLAAEVDLAYAHLRPR
jgi:hypothetical protein